MPSKKKKPSIAYVMGFMGISGGNRIIYEHANRLAEKGFGITLLHLNDGKDRDWFDINPQVKIIPFQNTDTWINNTDIIIATFNETLWNIIDLPKKIKKAYLVQSDERCFYEEDSLGKFLSNATYSFKDVHYYTTAKWMSDWLRQEYSIQAPVFKNKIDRTEFYPDPDPKLKSSKVILLVEGSLDTPLKGVQDAAEALKDLDCEKWLLTSSKSKFPDYVKIFDKVFSRPGTDRIRQIYSSADILLKPSRFESVSLPNMEAMCCGCSVITTNSIGILEYTSHLQNSYVVEVGNIVQMNKAILELIRNKTLRERLKKQGLEFAKEHFYNWDTEIDKLAKYFTELHNNNAESSKKRKNTRKKLESKYYNSKGLYLGVPAKIKKKIKNLRNHRVISH